MLKKLTYLISSVLMLGLVLTTKANAKLIQHLDASVEDSVIASGGVVSRWKDLSGNGNDAISGMGTVTYPSSIKFPGGSAGLDFGLERNTVEIFGSEASKQWLDQSAGTVGFAALLVSYTTELAGSWNDMIGNHSAVAQGFGVRYNASGSAQAYVKYTIGRGGIPVEVGDTIVWVFNYNASTGECYLWDSKNGYATTATRTAEDFTTGNPVTLGSTSNASRYFRGLIGEVMVFDAPLSEDELAMYQAELVYKWITPLEEKVYASVPTPSDGSTEVPLDGVTLSWKPGIGVEKHDVYFGTNFDDVNNATTTVDPAGVYMGRQSETTYVLDHLEFGQTYYWRIDEVGGAPDFTVLKGSVWSFTAEAFAYPIANENIIAIASSSNSVDEDPNNTINGSGLDDSGLLHSNIGIDNMWLSSTAGPQPTWIQYEFDKVYKLHQIWVWNHNTSTEPVIGFGIKEAAIEYSTDGANWITLGTTHEFARGTGTADYESNTTVDLSGVVARYVKITANSNWGGFVPQYGLSEVRFFYIPIRATEPSPVPGATAVNPDVTLAWRAGREAAQHDVYISTDEQAVIDGNVPVVTTLPEASYGPLSLDLAQTYYWKVNEVNTAETPTTLEGDIWNFTTREFLVVDDFESYNDLDPDDPNSNRIFNAWVDGYEQPANGSIVGYPTAPFAEQSIVHSGGQSMPLFYDNSGTARYSDAELTLSPPQDWTKHGAKALSLWFYGDPNNAIELMYVKLNGSKVTYDSDASNLTRIPWQPWNIDLASFGIDLQNVTKLNIGLGDETSMMPGGSGVVFVDDVKLYPYSRRLATPVEPNATGLVAHYEFEGNTDDSSGNGRHGTAMGKPTFVAGKVGQAISLDGFNDFVEITGYKGILGPNAVTVTAWISTTSTTTGTIINWGTQLGGQRIDLRVDADRLRVEHGSGNVQGDSNVNDGGWHHVAVTVQENATISHPEVILWLNGIDDTRPTTDTDGFNITADVDVSIGSRATNNDRFFIGAIDEVRIYDRALTPEEIAWLAGRRQPFDKPF